MKHSIRITILLILFFLMSQIIGLFIISQYISVEEVTKVDPITNKTSIIKEAIAVDLPNKMERPEFQSSVSFISYLIIAILLATVLFLFLIKLNTTVIWKLWFFFAVFLSLTIAFASFMPALLATLIGFLLAVWKIAKPNIIVHNLTELFIYGGLAAILVPISIVNEYAILILLALVSIYDAYSVWKSKHMIKMAQFQAKSRVFAGLLIPYKRQELDNSEKKDLKKSDKKSKKERKSKISKQAAKTSKSRSSHKHKQSKGKLKFKGIKTAILGGGDIAFPLLFAGAVMKTLMLNNTLFIAFSKAMIIPLFTSLALFFLFIKGREDRFYPALPFLSTGALIGYFVLLLITNIY